MHPIELKESLSRHLQVTTENGLRILIEMDEEEADPTAPENSLKAVESNHLQFDLRHAQRPASAWRIAGIHALPLNEEAIDRYSRAPFPFGILTTQKQRPQGEPFQLQGNTITYDNDTSSLIFSESTRTHFNVCILARNESALAYLRQSANHSNQVAAPDVTVRSSFSLVQFEPLVRQVENDVDFRVQRLDEHVVQIYAQRHQDHLSDDIQFNLQRLLGYNKALMVFQGWGLNNHFQYLPLSGLEKQVYQETQVLNVLTNKRALTLVSVRPVDHLYSILKQLAKSPRENYSLDDFEDFACKYPLEEVCCMLVQILTDGEDARYLVSKQIEASILHAQQFKKKEYALVNQSYSQQPRQLNRFGASSTVTKSIAPPFHARFGPSSGKSERPHQQNTGSNAFMPFVVHSQDSQDLNSTCFFQTLESHHVLALALRLLSVYGDSVRQQDLQVIEQELIAANAPVHAVFNTEFLPLRIRAIYTHLQRILRPIWDMNLTFRTSHSNFKKQFSNYDSFKPALGKLRGLLRVLDAHSNDLTRLTSIADQTQLLRKERHLGGITNPGIVGQVDFCTQLDGATQDKLELVQRNSVKNLMFFVRRCIDVIEFMRITSFEANQSLFQKMLQSLSKEDPAGSSLLKEVAETTFKDLVVQGEAQDNTLDLSRTSGRHQAQPKSRLIQKLFEATITLLNSTSSKDKHKMRPDVAADIRNRVSDYQRHCPTLFSSSQVSNFIGESILNQALRAEDTSRRVELITQGVEQLKTKPHLLNLKSVVPILCRTDNYLTIVDLCVLKAKYLRGLVDLSEDGDIADIEKEQVLCYDIVVNMFQALDRSIAEQEDKDILALRAFRTDSLTKRKDNHWFALFFKRFSNAKIDMSQKSNLGSKIVARIQAQGEHLLLKHLFSYLISSPRDFIKMNPLPMPDAASFKAVCMEVLNQETRVTKERLMQLVNLMSHPEYQEELLSFQCQFVIELCDLGDFQVNDAQVKEAEPARYHLSCEDKRHCCLITLDRLRERSRTFPEQGMYE